MNLKPTKGSHDIEQMNKDEEQIMLRIVPFVRPLQLLIHDDMIVLEKRKREVKRKQKILTLFFKNIVGDTHQTTGREIILFDDVMIFVLEEHILFISCVVSSCMRSSSCFSHTMNQLSTTYSFTQNLSPITLWSQRDVPRYVRT
jgi:hypothetical protein